MDDRQRDRLAENGSHNLTIEDRERTAIQGVVNVESFDDREIILDTELGLLTIRGEDLHITKLDLDEGEFSVDGLIWSLQYSAIGKKGVAGRGKGLLERLFR